MHNSELAAPIFSRGDFNRFFLRKYGQLARAALDPAQRRPDYTDPQVIAGIADAYRGFGDAMTPQGDVPRHIFMLWQQGWDRAPTIAKASAASWAKHNPGWTLHLLDERSLPQWAPTLPDFRMPVHGRPAQSNIARMAMLRAHGGVWADATLFCTRPLDDWLPQLFDAGLFIFHRPRPYRYVDIWFMAAAGGHPAIAAWHEQVRQYWALFRRPHHYYWMEYLLELLVATHAPTRQAWEAMPKHSALGPLAVQGNPFDTEAPRAIYDLIAENRIPVHKLSHKWPSQPSLADTPLGALTGLDRI